MAKHFKNVQSMLEEDVAAMFNAADFETWFDQTGSFPSFSDAMDAFETWASDTYEGEGVELVLAKHYVAKLADYIPKYGEVAVYALKDFTDSYVL